MADLFKGHIDSYELLDFLSDRLQDELNRINVEKSRGIMSWSDIRYAEYNRQRFTIKQHHKYLQSLYKEVEKGEQLENVARDNFADLDEPPF
tara:strand:+ start:122 stop:397 length:276 start_codon:yes stop_codon:yes gene_type:complete